MSLFRSFLAGTTALVALSTGALAADMDALPRIAPALAREPGPPDPPPPPPVCEKKKGYYQMPGTETCLKVGGLVRSAIYIHQDNVAGDVWGILPGPITDGPTHNDPFTMQTIGRISADAVTKTSYGDLRGRVEFSGSMKDASPTDGNVKLRYAFITLGGWTLGRADSFFAAGDGALGGYVGPLGDFGGATNLIGYTAELSKEVKASIALESHDAVDGADGDADKNADVYLSSPAPPLSAFHNDGTQMPDLTGNIIGEFDWGNIAVAGALSRYRFYDSAAGGTYKGDFMGWAAGLGSTIKLDGIAKGDAIQGKVGYADGATGYLGSSDDAAIIDNIGPDFGVALTSGYSLEGSFHHEWNDVLNSTLHSGYVGAMRTTNADTVTAIDDAPIAMWSVGANLIWKPTADINIGADVYYASITKDNSVTGESTVGALGSLFHFDRTF